MLLNVGVIDIIELYAVMFSTLCCLQNAVVSVTRATKYESLLLSAESSLLSVFSTLLLLAPTQLILRLQSSASYCCTLC